MIDLGKDVPPETIVAAAVENNVKAVGLSALMTTTLKSMEETIAMLKEAKPECKVLVGGAVLTEEYSKKIGADYYCSDAMKSVEAAKQIYG
jgi:5-methyltetrahydrofolate--homocysteine methyltransferase